MEEDSIPQATIVIVDDDRRNLASLEAVLEPLGHRLVLADSAAVALRLLASEEFAAILCDVRMPGMDGFEMLARLRDQGLAKRTPVVLMSAIDLDRENARRAYELGVVDYVTKPIDPEFFRWRVGALVALYQGGGRRRNGSVGTTAEVAEAAVALERSAAIAREAERLITRKDTFVGILGHDLRNPLAAVILGCQELARAADIPERYRARVDRVIHAAERMNQMIEDILDFSRTSSGVTFPTRPRVVDLGQLATMVVDEAREVHPDRVMDIAIKGDPLVECDPDRIAQALGNLVKNAVEHGEGAVGVLARCEEQQVTVEVHNAGAPIPQEAMATLFDPFRRRDEGTAGLGLGLHIVKEIVRAHGGTVWVSSSQKDGTTFEMCWPRHVVVPAMADGGVAPVHP